MRQPTSAKTVYKRPSGPGYKILNTGLSVLFFVLVYKFWIEKQFTANIITHYVYTFGAMLITGYAASVFAAVITHYYEDLHWSPVNASRTLFTALIYALLIVWGLIKSIFETYPLVSITEASVALILIIIKVAVYVSSDFIVRNFFIK